MSAVYSKSNTRTILLKYFSVKTPSFYKTIKQCVPLVSDGCWLDVSAVVTQVKSLPNLFLHGTFSTTEKESKNIDFILILFGRATYRPRSRSSYYKVRSHEKNNTVVKVTLPSKNIVLLFCQPERVVISISLPN